MLDRRDALKSIIIGGVASILTPNTLLASTAKKKEKLGIALVGLGYYSTDLLAPALQATEKCYLAGIVTGTPEKSEKWKQKYNIPDKNIYDYQNFDSIANNPDIDIVYVVLPPSMHKEYTIRAAKAGKHVFCEKPMAPSVNDCMAMIKVCKDNKVNLAIGYRCQHDPNTQEYMRITREKLYGKVKMVACGAGYFDARTTHWKQNKGNPTREVQRESGCQPPTKIGSQRSWRHGRHCETKQGVWRGRPGLPSQCAGQFLRST
jgi:glucose-fructose oxidoreductase